jgi:protein required for attachment to host cells
MTSSLEVTGMTRSSILWIAVVDGEHARFVQPDANNALRSVQAMDSAAAHLSSHELGADRPGRSFESAGSAHHAVGEKHDLHAMEKQKFVRMIAEQLNAAAERGAFDELLLVAPPHALHDLLGGLGDAAQAKLVGTLDKDLVKTPDHELWPHVREWVTPERRPLI